LAELAGENNEVVKMVLEKELEEQAGTQTNTK